MKKQYNKPIIEMENLEIDDVTTSSGVETKKFNTFLDPDGEADFEWNWGE